MRTTFLDREGGDRGPRARRGPARFVFTYENYAKMLGVSVKTLQNAASLGKFDPRDIESVFAYVIAHRAKKEAVRARSLRLA